jgi:hypothetical protein
MMFLGYSELDAAAILLRIRTMDLCENCSVRPNIQICIPQFPFESLH